MLGPAGTPEDAGAPLRILHVLRAPVGGLFRHVVDLVRGQAARGHRVGVVADALSGGERAEAMLSQLAPALSLGLTRAPMSRQIGWRDVTAWRHVMARLVASEADVIHGHGAKGGAYARLTDGRAFRVYTPHGGTLNFPPQSPAGMLYLRLERLLKRRTELFLFESAHAERMFRHRVGDPSGIVRVVHNGVSAAEFEPVASSPDATELLFVGELRHLKGIDVLIEAVALLAGAGRPLRATIVGHGPDADTIMATARSRGVASLVRFVGAMPARDAFALGQTVVVPSRAESLPYIVLEAAAAGMPMIATSVGGIPEIFGAQSDRLVPPGNPAALAAAISAALDDRAGTATATATLRSRVQSDFSVDAMVDQVLGAYRAVIQAAAGRGTSTQVR